MLPIKVNRKTPTPALQPFTDYFKGFEKVEAVRKVFGEETEAVLARLKLGFISNMRMYMGIRDDDGNIAVGTYHLRHSPTRVLYLDIVHELFHIKQWMEDKEWFTKEHEKFMSDFSLYYSSPIEVPAYKHAVREAERLGMSPEEITEYLKMLPVPPKLWNRFLKEMGVKRGAGTARSRPRRASQERLPVRINRNPKLVLLPFKGMFGKGATEALRGLKVEFLESPFGSIFPSEEDGHLVVNSSFVKGADIESIYLDVILSLAFIQRAAGSASASLDSEEMGFDESPRALESYKAMVNEARRIGVPDARIMERLQLPRFMMEEAAFNKFVKAIGLKA
jgi:hypothetical protein